MALILSEIFIYPVKSLGGISLLVSETDQLGLKFDRRMMLVDVGGYFLTQRIYPQMALLKTSLENDSIRITDSRSGASLILIHNQSTGEKMRVKIWGDEVSALGVSEEADTFFSDALGLKCRLVLMPDKEKRIVDRHRKYVGQEHLVGFADGYPFLILGQSSLNDLNLRLKKPVPVNRFRPNFVFTGGEPFCEDKWSDFTIGAAAFRAVKPCARCVITTTDQDTAAREKEPLKTLAAYRKFNKKVLFGMNLICTSGGVVSVGDKILLKD